MNKKFFVTTPIYYPNDNLHIGHAYTTILADYIVRYKKLKGYDVFFLTGSDEHGQKIDDNAKLKGEDTLTFVTKKINNFKYLWEKLGIDYDKFIRTTDKEHETFVANTFVKFQKDNLIYKDDYEGWYCKSDEAFFTETMLNEEHKCPTCGKEVFLLKEESYFLKIAEFKDWIKKTLEEGEILFPKNRVNELINNFVNNLKDLSITRTSFTWGIPVIGDEKHIIYVWMDALLNYISALTYPDSKWTPDEVWSKNSNVEILQLVGKEITRFHSIYWPIMLNMLNYRKPRVLAHGWLVTDDDVKISKSLGNVVNPLTLIELYGRDSLRFYLINNIVTGEDGKFSEQLLVENTNGILVNKFSNLVSRTDGMVKKYFNGIVPSRGKILLDDETFYAELITIQNKFDKEIMAFKFSNSTKTLVAFIEAVNDYIDKTAPWKITDQERLGTVLNILISSIFKSAVMLSPVLVDSSEKISVWLKTPLDFKFYDKDFVGYTLLNIGYLFSRIEYEK